MEPRSLLSVVAAVLAGGLAAGCFNDNNPTALYGGGQRLELVVEPARTDVDGTHFLLDTATGDLWRLEARGAAPGRWVRVADGPADLAKLSREALFPSGEPAERTP